MEKKKMDAKRYLFAGFTACLVILMIFTSCKNGMDPIPVPDRDVTYTLEQVGGTNYIIDSTAIKIKFSTAVADLTAGQINITGAASKDPIGTITQDGSDWIIPVKVNYAGAAVVTVSRKGIESGSKNVRVHKIGAWSPISYNVTANGAVDSISTTALTFTFEEDLEDVLAMGGLTPFDITINPGTGYATKGVILGSGKVWLLFVYAEMQGTVNVSITKNNIIYDIQTLTIAYKPNVLAPEKPNIGRKEDGLYFTADVDLSSQSAINTARIDENKVKGVISFVWTGAGADSYNIYWSDEALRPANPGATGITEKVYFIRNLDLDTKYYFWVEAINEHGRVFSDVSDKDTRGITGGDGYSSNDGLYYGLERGDYVRNGKIEASDGTLNVTWELSDRVGWFEIYVIPAGQVPHLDRFERLHIPNAMTAANAPTTQWGMHAYDSTTNPIGIHSWDFFNGAWRTYYIGANNGRHSDTRPVMGINQLGTDDTIDQYKDVKFANAFPFLGEAWVEGNSVLNSVSQQGINAGKALGLGYLQPYTVLDSHFANAVPWTATGPGTKGKAYPYYQTSATITGLTNGTQYEVWIRCPNIHGERGYFYIVGTPGASNLPAVSNIKVSAPQGTTRDLAVSWNAVATATSYRVYSSQFNSVPKLTDPYSRFIGTSGIMEGLKGDTPYYVWVVAELDNVAGIFGPAVTGRTGPVASFGIPGKPKFITGTNYPVKTLMYIEVNDHNPLNAGSYILDDGAYLFDYLVIFASNIRARNCAIMDPTSGCTRNGPHLHHNPNNRHILTNASKYIRPLQEKGIKVLLGILPDHDGIGLGNMSETEMAAFVESVRMDVALYGLDGIDLDDEWASKEDWDFDSKDANPTSTSIWVYPISSWGWPHQLTIYRDPAKGIEPGNGTIIANSTSDQARMWRELGVGTYKTITALREALGPDKVISVYEYNTGRYITPDTVSGSPNNNSLDTSITSLTLAGKIDFSLNPMYNQYLANSANGLPRSQYGSLAIDVSGGAYAAQNGAPNPPWNTTGTNSITDYATRFKTAAVEGNPYGFICLYGLNPSSSLLKTVSTASTATESKEKYLSVMTEIIFGRKTLLTSEGGDFRKDW